MVAWLQPYATIVTPCYAGEMKTFTYLLRPNKAQEQALWSVLIGSRHLYNQLLDECVAHYKETEKHLTIYEQDKRHGSKEHPALPAVVVDTTLKRVHRSFRTFFEGRKEGRRVGFPRFKGATRWHSFAFRDAGNCLDGRYFKAGKLCGGRIRTVAHRPLEGTFTCARIIHRPSGWYLHCVCETSPQPLPAQDTAIGLDMGLTYLVADSDAHMVRNPKNLQKRAQRLARAQRVLCRRHKGSARRKKAGRRVARLHERIANQRKDTLHKVSQHYVNGYQTIAIENVQPANMVQNHALARAISDASWGTLRSLLSYKAEDAGRHLVAVPPHYTSQRCSRCKGHVQKSLSVRTHVCPSCGYVADRDTNAALNILCAAQKGPDGAVGDQGKEAAHQQWVSPGKNREAAGL